MTGAPGCRSPPPPLSACHPIATSLYAGCFVLCSVCGAWPGARSTNACSDHSISFPQIRADYMAAMLEMTRNGELYVTMATRSLLGEQFVGMLRFLQVLPPVSSSHLVMETRKVLAPAASIMFLMRRRRRKKSDIFRSKTGGGSDASFILLHF